MATSEEDMLIREEEQHVTPIELFFDLVYVFALIQLSNTFIENLTWSGAAEMAIVYTAVFTVWASTMWTTGLLNVARRRVLMLLLVVTLLALFMNASIPMAFEDTGWLFAAAFLAIQVGRTAWFLTIDLSRPAHDYIKRTLTWGLATAPLLIAGAIAGPELRLLFWAIAFGIGAIGLLAAYPLPGRTTVTLPFEVSSSYVVERFRHFFLIALGETVIMTGYALVDELPQLMTLLTGSVAFLVIATIWWIQFHRAEGAIALAIHESVDTARGQRNGEYVLYSMVAGLLLIAVGNNLVILEPFTQTDITTNLLLYGGPAMFLAAQAYAWYTHEEEPGHVPRAHSAGIVALVVVGILMLAAPRFVAAIGAAGILLAVAVAESRLPGLYTESVFNPEESSF